MTAAMVEADGSIALEPGVRMPTLGFGVFQVSPKETERAVADALEAGYRHIDTAAIYGNEREVGRAIAASGLRRDEVFLTTKLWNADQGRGTRVALERSLDALDVDFVDLYLIHWPVPAHGRAAESWGLIAEAQHAGLVRAAGVSNFTEGQLDDLVSATGIVPTVNQVELHPYLAQTHLVEAMQARHITVTAWSPLAKAEALVDPVITAIANRLQVSTAQTVLRWHLQRGIVVIPKTVSPERMRNNRQLFGFELSPEDLAAIDRLDRGYRTGPDPEHFNEI
jgi:2,5-diketo-D-gluconate reductase A